ncbi:MAG: hypothetical protein RBU30_15970, partial [Polyangia bacterium]|nr:hypothetical protein [Polyangia bacterium]
MVREAILPKEGDAWVNKDMSIRNGRGCTIGLRCRDHRCLGQLCFTCAAATIAASVSFVSPALPRPSLPRSALFHLR